MNKITFCSKNAYYYAGVGPASAVHPVRLQHNIKAVCNYAIYVMSPPPATHQRGSYGLVQQSTLTKQSSRHFLRDFS